MSLHPTALHRLTFTLAGTVLLLTGGAARIASAQATGVQQMPPQPSQPMFGQPPGVNPANPMDPGIPPRMAAAAARARNNERQKRLEAETEKLLQLATQLHTDVGRTDKNILSVDVMKRSEEIEKLAHAIKENMKGQ